MSIKQLCLDNSFGAYNLAGHLLPQQLVAAANFSLRLYGLDKNQSPAILEEICGAIDNAATKMSNIAPNDAMGYLIFLGSSLFAACARYPQKTANAAYIATKYVANKITATPQQAIDTAIAKLFKLTYVIPALNDDPRITTIRAFIANMFIYPPTSINSNPLRANLEGLLNSDCQNSWDNICKLKIELTTPATLVGRVLGFSNAIVNIINNAISPVAAESIVEDAPSYHTTPNDFISGPGF